MGLLTLLSPLFKPFWVVNALGVLLSDIVNNKIEWRSDIMSNLRDIPNKEKIRLINTLFKGYRVAKLKNENDCLVRVIDQIISYLDEDSQLIIIKEFMYKSKSSWYLEYYSKSTYYRLKNAAMINFLDCLPI